MFAMKEDPIGVLRYELTEVAVRFGYREGEQRPLTDWQSVIKNTMHYSGMDNLAYHFKYYGPPGVDVNGLFTLASFTAAVEYVLRNTAERLLQVTHAVAGTTLPDGSQIFVDSDLFQRTITPSEFRSIFASNPEAEGKMTFPEELGFTFTPSVTTNSLPPSLGNSGPIITNRPVGVVGTTASSVADQSTPSEGTLSIISMSMTERELRDTMRRLNATPDESHSIDQWTYFYNRTPSWPGITAGMDQLTPGWTDGSIQYTLAQYIGLLNEYIGKGDVIRQAAVVVQEQIPSGMMDLLKMLYDLIGRILAGKR